MGLGEDIIDRASGLLEGGDIAFEEVISSLEEDKKRAEEERDEAIAINIEMKRQKEELDKKAKNWRTPGKGTGESQRRGAGYNPRSTGNRCGIQRRAEGNCQAGESGRTQQAF